MLIGINQVLFFTDSSWLQSSNLIRVLKQGMVISAWEKWENRLDESSFNMYVAFKHSGKIRCLGAHQMVRISRCSFQYRASAIAGTVLNMLFCRNLFMTLRLRNFYRMYKTFKSADILECNRQTRIVELGGNLKVRLINPTHYSQEMNIN